jgi:hypothetical protein
MDAHQDRVALRREALAMKDAAIHFAARLSGVDEEARDAVHRARLALFEAWTMLCTPPEDDDDDPSH